MRGLARGSSRRRQSSRGSNLASCRAGDVGLRGSRRRRGRLSRRSRGRVLGRGSSRRGLRGGRRGGRGRRGRSGVSLTAKGVSEVNRVEKRTLRPYRRSLAGTDAAGLVGDRLRAGDLLVVDGGVVGALEPVAEAELAAGLKSRRQLVASVAAEAAVLGTPAGGGRSPLSSAGVVDTHTATGDGKVKLTLTNVGASIGGLDDHLLAGNSGGGEGEPV